MAPGGGSIWQVAAAHLLARLLMDSASGRPCSLAMAAEAVQAGVVPVLLGCLAFTSGQPGDAAVQCEAAGVLEMLTAALVGLGSPASRRRQLSEPMRRALQPTLAALAGLLRSTQLPAVAAAMLRAMSVIAVLDEALAAEAVAAGAVVLATQWSRRPGALEDVVQAAKELLIKLRPGAAVPAGVATATPEASSSSRTESAAGQGGSGGGQAAGCAACGAASKADGKVLMRCSACRGVSYCSGACQRRHWGEHKGACRPVGC
jgi:hypothetical protein